MKLNNIISGNASGIIESFPDEYFDTCITSPPSGISARKLNRNFIGIELSKDYLKIAEDRIYKELGFFK